MIDKVSFYDIDVSYVYFHSQDIWIFDEFMSERSWSK